MKRKQSLRVLIGTVGGQGGGVLSDWLIHGLLNANWNAVSIGLLGLSQRAGTVTYYCEASSDKEAKIVNSMFAVPGDVNLFIGQELLELGRLLSSGYASEDCVIVGSLGRTYTTLEKMPSEAGVYDSSIIATAAQNLSPNNNYLIDAPAFVTANNLQNLTSNAFLLGVVVASEVIDLPPEPFIKAIEDSEVNVNGNIQAFQLGYRMFKEGKIHPGINQLVDQKELQNFPAEKRSSLIDYLPESNFINCSEATTQLIKYSYDRLTSYQDKKYAQSLLKMIESIQGQAQIREKTVNAFIKNAALWLCYEDIPRVGQLKTDPERYLKIFKEHGIDSHHIVKITDFFVPDVEQLVGMLPKPLARFVKKIGILFSKDFESKSFPLRIQSTSILGYWALRFLALGRYWRRLSLRHQIEMEHFNYWLNNLRRIQDQSPAVAQIIAELGRVVKGYGHVRVKAINDVYVFIDEAVPHLLMLEREGVDIESLGARALSVLAGEAGKIQESLQVIYQFSNGLRDK